MPEDISLLPHRYKELNLHEVLDHEKFNQYSIVHHAALLYVLESAKAKESISVSFIQAINALVMKNTD